MTELRTPTQEPERLLQYFITVGIGDSFISLDSISELESFRPITALAVCVGNEPPASFELVRRTINGHSCSLRNGYFGAHVWLAFSRDPDLGEPITEILLIKQDECPPGFTKINYSFQKTFKRGDMFGLSTTPPTYIYYERDPMKVPLSEVIFVAHGEGEIAPPDFWNVQTDVKSGARFGTGLGLYYKKCPATPLDQIYKPNVIDRYPRRDHTLSPLPVAVAQFCQPNGSVLMHSAPLPTSHEFVLTNSMGRRMYGSALTCFEPLQVDVWQRSLESILQRFPRMTQSQDVLVSSRQHDDMLSGRTLPPRSVTADCQSPEHKARFLSLSFESKPLYTSKTICLLSYYPFFDSFKVMLAELYRISVSPRTIPLEKHLSNLFEIPVPLSPSLAAEIEIGSKRISFHIPDSDDDFPLLNCSLSLTFQVLPLPSILTALSALILERSVILFSSHARLLTPVANTLLALMFPLEWQYSYVPVLPRVITGILEAPMPVFVGIRQAYVNPRLFDRPDLVIVNLDAGSVFVHPDNPLLPLPTAVTTTLKNELETFGRISLLPKITNEELDCLDLTFNVMPNESRRCLFNERSIRASFVHMFTSLFGRFRDHLLFPSQPSNLRLSELFEKKTFLAKCRGRQFVKALVETQCFTRFIEERTFPSDRDAALRFFDHCCDHQRSVDAVLDKRESPPGLVQSLLRQTEYRSVYRVPPPPRPGTDALIPAYEVFPMIDDSLLYEPRPIVPEHMKGWGSSGHDDILHTEFQEAFFPSRPSSAMVQHCFHSRHSSGKLTDAFQSSSAWAWHLMKLLYSAWFLFESLSVDWATFPDDSIVERVFAVLNRARGVDIVPDESTYRSILKLCAKFSRAESARIILQLMKDTGIQPSQVTYAFFTSAVTEAPISPRTRQSVEEFNTGTRTASSLVQDVAAAVDVNWEETFMSTVSICPCCNSRLSNSEIMSGWSDDSELESTKCVLCRGADFRPDLHVRLTLADCTTESFTVGYLSPLVLRTQLDKVTASEPKETFKPNNFRLLFPTLFYNLLWYWYHENLPLDVLVGKASVVIKTIGGDHRKESTFTQQEREANTLARFGDGNRDVMGALAQYIRRSDLRNAMRLFLLHRIREANLGGSGAVEKPSVWSQSMFRSLDGLGAQWFFPSRSEWVHAYTHALHRIPKHMAAFLLPMDSAPPTRISIFDQVFKHDQPADHPDDVSNIPTQTGLT